MNFYSSLRSRKVVIGNPWKTEVRFFRRDRGRNPCRSSRTGNWGSEWAFLIWECLFKKDQKKRCVPATQGDYNYCFWLDPSVWKLIWPNHLSFLQELEKSIIELLVPQQEVPITTRIVQRPALFSSIWWVQPPEDPLCKVARQIGAKLQL